MKIIYSLKISGYLAVLIILVGCRTPPTPARIDPEIERQVAAARSAYSGGAIKHAADSFNKALQRARLIDDNREISRCAYNHAVCLAALRQWPAAEASLTEARFACSTPDNPPHEFILMQARIAHGGGGTEEAVALIRDWLNRTQKADQTIRAIFEVLLGELLFESGDYAAAREVLSAITGDPEKSLTDNSTRAGFYRLQAQLAREAAEERNAAIMFDAAANIYRDLKEYRKMADCLADSARAWHQAGALQAATERFYRAARSLSEQGDRAGTEALVTEALQSKIEDTLLKQLLENLAGEITE